MTPGLNKKDRRQFACIQRARSARFYAKVLMPITAVVLCTAVWSDPVAQPQLQQKLDTYRPMVDAALEGRPISEIVAASPFSIGSADSTAKTPALAGLPFIGSDESPATN